MNRPRLDLGLDASRATLNEAECVRIGKLLAAARQSRRLSVQDVAGRILLAPAQVSALESVRPDAFYSAEFYAAAQKKYAALVGLDCSEMERVLVKPAPVAPVPAFKRGRRSMALSLAGVPRPSKRVMIATGVVVTAVAGGLLVASVLERSPARSIPDAGRVATAPPPAAPAVPEPVTLPDAPALVPAPVTTSPESVDEPAPPALVPVSSAPPKSVGRVRVGQRTWVFVRFAAGNTVERTLAGGEELLLKDVPVYIAVGNADEASIEIGGQPIDASLFTINGQLRVGSSQLARLVAMR